MLDFFQWFTDLGNSKTAAAVIFFAVFVGIIIYVFTNKDRKARYDDYCKIPLMDEEDLGSVNPTRYDEYCTNPLMNEEGLGSENRTRNDQTDLSNSH